MAGKAVRSAVPGEGPSDYPQVGQHFGRPSPSGADATADMRDGDSDSGTTAPDEPETSVPGSAASEALRGGGTP
jgi:hypothetical protein